MQQFQTLTHTHISFPFHPDQIENINIVMDLNPSLNLSNVEIPLQQFQTLKPTSHISFHPDQIENIFRKYKYLKRGYKYTQLISFNVKYKRNICKFKRCIFRFINLSFKSKLTKSWVSVEHSNSDTHISNLPKVEIFVNLSFQI